MATVRFSKEELMDSEGLELPDYIDPSRGKIIEDVPMSKSRWSTSYKLIFELDGKTYQTSYSVGSTEMQEERPWEYESEITCIEVEPVEVMKIVWKPIKSVEVEA